MPKNPIDIGFSSSSIDSFFQKPEKRRVASSPSRIRIASVAELSGFQLVSSDTLVRISQHDFWRLGRDEEGDFIERLVDDTETPVKG